MKKFKFTDLAIQCILIVAIILMIIFRYEQVLLYYILLVGWQLMSIAVHEAKFWFLRNKSRRYYHITILFMLFAGSLSLSIPVLSYAILIILFWSSVMVVYYFILCLWEWHQLHVRPLSILK
ncbi:MAG: hypothetical protein J0I41_15490 [Filimonas sp.]|nr:hypothetical protein [Filimonas sp.]